LSELLTPSQTVGPYFAMRLPWPEGPFVVPADAPDAVTIIGRLFDGAGDVIPDGLIETWQADPAGRFAHPDDPRAPVPVAYTPFRGFGRCETSHDGSFKIVTLKPGALPFGDGRVEAPHIDVSVFARGMLDRSVTRIYFPDEVSANEADPVLQAVPADRRSTLIAVPVADGVLQFDIHMQGDQETVFFDL
jgi:protocatechuate 3,4-dioxygenase, alpha subunit